MNKVICSWCKSPHTKKQPANESVKFEEYICQECNHSTWHQTDYDINKLLPFSEANREFFMLEPDCFSRTRAN